MFVFSSSSLESSTPPSPDHMRISSSSTPPPRTHNGRQRLRPFLISLLDNGKVRGLEWMNKEKTLFKIPWKHAGKQDYNPEEDSKIFKVILSDFTYLQLHSTHRLFCPLLYEALFQMYAFASWTGRSSSPPFSSPRLPVGESFGPSIVICACYVPCPSPFRFFNLDYLS